ncbi:MAG: RluA family pseudouridine synthase [Bacillota bacterium]|nr:RluA family pseudouridine synthase [Bacillota bacterium]
MKIEKILIEAEDEGFRIDKFLNEYYPDMSRSFLQNIIKEGNVTISEKAVKSNYRLKEGDLIIISIPELKEIETLPENIPLDILYEDKDVIVVNKPQGMVVHPAQGNYSGTLVNGLLYHCSDLSGINGVLRPGIVHRIDKDTSGVIVAAKNDFSHINLSSQLKEHSMTRIYNCIAYGHFKESEFTVDKPLGRDKNDRKKIAVRQDGKKAISHFKVLEEYKNFSLLECSLETGRTHQIRVHLSSMSHPIVGDRVYGIQGEKFKLNGQLLHARILGFNHPRSNIYMEFEAPYPEYFQEFLSKLKNS